MHFSIETSWDKVLSSEYEKPYFIELGHFVKEERLAGKHIFPPRELVFNAFQKTPFKAVKVVIMGQDPYHGLGQAHGLSFSVLQGVRPPPSLQNIFKELAEDIGKLIPSHGCLEAWAEQGVLLLNALLTVEENKPLSHKGRGWEQFTDAVIRALALREDPVLFLLWGRNAIDKCLNVQELSVPSQHSILKAAHPSPFSAHSGFFGCKHFSRANQILIQWGKTPIQW